MMETAILLVVGGGIVAFSALEVLTRVQAGQLSLPPGERPA
jgi:hypothetical protein